MHVYEYDGIFADDDEFGTLGNKGIASMQAWTRIDLTDEFVS